MSRKDESKAKDAIVTVNIDDFTRTRDSVSFLVLVLFCFTSPCAIFLLLLRVALGDTTTLPSNLGT